MEEEENIPLINLHTYDIVDADTFEVIGEFNPTTNEKTIYPKNPDPFIQLEIEEQKIKVQPTQPWSANMQYEYRPTYPKILTRVRRFIVVKEHSQRGTHHVGDIFEEIFYKPNTFCNVSRLERENIRRIYWNIEIRLSTINSDNRIRTNYAATNQNFESLVELIEDIDTKESFIFQLNNCKKAGASYKSRMKKFAQLNEELTNLKYLLEIKDEED